MAVKSAGRLTRKIGHQEYEIRHGDDRICHIPKSKVERLQLLKTFVLKECGKCWAFEDPRISTLKKQYLHELVEGLK